MDQKFDLFIFGAGNIFGTGNSNIFPPLLKLPLNPALHFVGKNKWVSQPLVCAPTQHKNVSPFMSASQNFK